MFTMFFWLLFGFYCIAFGFLCSLAASQKGREPGRWFVIGLLFGIFGLVAALIIDPVADSELPSYGLAQANTSDSATCPFCAETIKRRATVCRYCGRDLPSGWAANQIPQGQEVSASGTSGVYTEIVPRPIRLCQALRHGDLPFSGYEELANVSGGKFECKGLPIITWTYTRAGEAETFKKWKSIRPWFLENVVPEVEWSAQQVAAADCHPATRSASG